MIRINLIGAERQKARRPAGGGISVAQKITLACSLVLLATALLIGWWYWSLNERSTRLDAEMAEAEREKGRLRSVIQQVQQFEARRAQLEERVALIEQLRKGQTGPVRLLDELSRSLPDMLWLTELTHKGGDLTITGRASSLTALSDFVGNLEGSTFIRKPVEILDSQVEAAPGGELVRFSVKAQFSGGGE